MPALCPNQARQTVANRIGLRHPTGFVPTRDQHLAPFGLHHGLNPRRRCFGQRPEGIAIKIKNAVGQVEERFGFLKNIAHF